MELLRQKVNENFVDNPISLYDKSNYVLKNILIMQKKVI